MLSSHSYVASSVEDDHITISYYPLHQGNVHADIAWGDDAYLLFDLKAVERFVEWTV